MMMTVCCSTWRSVIFIPLHDLAVFLPHCPFFPQTGPTPSSKRSQKPEWLPNFRVQHPTARLGSLSLRHFILGSALFLLEVCPSSASSELSSKIFSSLTSLLCCLARSHLPSLKYQHSPRLCPVRHSLLALYIYSQWIHHSHAYQNNEPVQKSLMEKKITQNLRHLSPVNLYLSIRIAWFLSELDHSIHVFHSLLY